LAAARLSDAGAGSAARIPVRRPLLSVGIATADWLSMGTELARLEEGGADFVHFDVMDGSFSPPLTLGPPVIAAMRTPLRKDVHLMIEDPLARVGDYVAAGADVVTVHVEAGRHPHRVLQALGSMRTPSGGAVTRGIALNPGTAVAAAEPLLEELELVLVLAVNPGWGGQGFLPTTERRLEAMREVIVRCGRPVMLGVDGGITRDNVAAVARMGVDVIVTGSAVFDGGDAVANLRAIRAAVEEGFRDEDG
jgi:ribulose-phosphate 3-epimerase